jgi:hypothetical protein
MLLFRSKEHVDAWLSSGRPRGEELSVAVQWNLARLWFAGRDEPEWRKRSAAEAEAVFRQAGLTSDFWTLT